MLPDVESLGGVDNDGVVVDDSDSPGRWEDPFGTFLQKSACQGQETAKPLLIADTKTGDGGTAGFGGTHSEPGNPGFDILRLSVCIFTCFHLFRTGCENAACLKE